MALDLKVSIRREIDRLNRKLTADTAQLAALQDEIRMHEQIYDMLDGKSSPSSLSSPRKQVRKPRGGLGEVQKRGPSGSMIDWKAVFASLPGEFTLDTMSANKTASEKSRSYLRQVVVRWSKEGRIKRTGRGVYQKV